jgi:two-component system response regulator HydG
VALCPGGALSIEDLPEKVRLPSVRAATTTKSESAPNLTSLFDVERSHILKSLETLGGNKTQAADLLGLDRRTLERRLKRYESAAAPRSNKSG